MRDALPRVADPAVHLHRGLAHGARGAGAVRLGDATRGARLGGGEVVDGPRRVQRDAERALHEAVAPRRAGAARPGTSRRERRTAVRSAAYATGDVEHAAHHADEVGAREREPERGPRREIVVREEVASLADRCATGVPAGIVRTGAGEIGTACGSARRARAKADGPCPRARARRRGFRVTGVDRVRRLGRCAGRVIAASVSAGRRDHRAAGRTRTGAARRGRPRARDPRTARRRPHRRARRRRSRPPRRSRGVRRLPAASRSSSQPASRTAAARRLRAWRRRGRRRSPGRARVRVAGPSAGARPARACPGCPPKVEPSYSKKRTQCPPHAAMTWRGWCQPLGCTTMRGGPSDRRVSSRASGTSSRPSPCRCSAAGRAGLRRWRRGSRTSPRVRSAAELDRDSLVRGLGAVDGVARVPTAGREDPCPHLARVDDLLDQSRGADALEDHCGLGDPAFPYLLAEHVEGRLLGRVDEDVRCRTSRRARGGRR